ncbi:hypothetical protein RRG08_063165 [Elysia crispata]|uniref:Uncharacterized protein n=1 Tax=Elysia crispata TaxID=231223 RepID=A0AAE0XRR5_9GAST|nr:hypothetical protein RRG08_063165 [Elysia crispata]
MTLGDGDDGSVGDLEMEMMGQSGTNIELDGAMTLEMGEMLMGQWHFNIELMGPMTLGDGDDGSVALHEQEPDGTK